MAIKKRSESVALTVSNAGSTNVILNVTIGNAQIGGNLVKWKHDQQVVKKGKIENLDLGSPAFVKGKTLTVITNILDVNEQTNGVVATYAFHNCTPFTTSFDDKVDNDGDIFSLTVDFIFN